MKNNKGQPTLLSFFKSPSKTNKRSSEESEVQEKKKVKIIKEPLHSLLFNPISVGSNGYDHQHARTVMKNAINNYLHKNVSKNIHIYLTIPSNLGTFNFLEVEDDRFRVIKDDILNLEENSSYIVHECNWRFSPNNAPLAEKDPSLFPSVKSKYNTAAVTNVYPIMVDQSSQLYKINKVRCVLFTCSPNMNPSKQDDLNNDYEKGDKLLQETYENIFNAFDKLIDNKDEDPDIEVVEQPKAPANESPDIFLPAYDPPPIAFCVNTGGSWDSALLNIVNDANSDSNKRRTFYSDSQSMVVYDPYPKSKVHLLMISKVDIVGPKYITSEHIPHLQHNHDIAHKIVAHLKTQFPESEFKIGYHSVPSMRRLHLHIISQDFDSPCLKNKKHYNSYNTLFFIDAENAMDELLKNGKLNIDNNKAEQLLKADLKCSKCACRQQNMPKLKFHISKCNE
ncbi:transcription factor [Acrasis kona]|uniref:Transcription factor n=1 Tax=Acrasis kona TaxID=1008807 RepID=A0AAW2ZEZ2_9EUKA